MKPHNSNQGRRIASYGQPKLKARGPRPHLWATGPDPVLHKKHRVWIQQKNQAQWRGEGWDLPFEAWLEIWAESGQWENRGRERGTWCMTRRDWTEPWSVPNVHVVTREQHSRAQGEAAAAGHVSEAQIRARARLAAGTGRKKPGPKPRKIPP
jgi:hypothetical protein